MTLAIRDDSPASHAAYRVLHISMLTLAVALSACVSKPPRPASASLPGSELQPSSRSAEIATVTPQLDGSPGNLSDEERAARAALEREGTVIYFDYDSAQIRAEFLPLLGSHAKFASRFRDVSVRLEGHTDERGSREYNIALGERRAQAVRNALELQGVVGSRVMTVSYGEESPAAAGSTEGSWSRNRRVEISYLR